MEIEVKIEAGRKEPKIIIIAGKLTDEIDAIIKRLSEDEPRVIAGIRDELLEILEPEEIVRIYSADKKVFAGTEKGEYVLRLRLYEVEERLDGKTFVRISNSEIINMRKVRSFDLSLAGTICVIFKDGSRSYASRRYVSRIKSILGI